MSEDVVRETVADWNKFIQSLVAARELWDKLQRHMDNNPVHGDNLPPKVQKLLSMFRRMQFTTAIGDLADHWRAYGGLDSFFVELPENEAIRESYDNLIEKTRRVVNE